MCSFRAVSGGTRTPQESAERQGPGFNAGPAIQTQLTVRMGDVNLDEHGGVTGRFTFVMNGQEALRWRQSALEEDGRGEEAVRPQD